jgi:hypothetical protein
VWGNQVTGHCVQISIPPGCLNENCAGNIS